MIKTSLTPDEENILTDFVAYVKQSMTDEKDKEILDLQLKVYVLTREQFGPVSELGGL